MDVAALITWLATAVGGFVLLGTWLTRGGVRQAQAGQSRFPRARSSDRGPGHLGAVSPRFETARAQIGP